MTETWRPVVGWDGRYEVSDRGRVRSLPRVVRFSDGRQRRVAGGALRCSVSSNGYPTAHLTRDNRTVSRTVHSLVLTAFVGPRPAGMVACHRDDDRLNNALTNLRWDTPAANNYDAVRNGRNAMQRKKRCKRGHRLVPPNLVSPRLPTRVCRACVMTRPHRRSTARLSAEELQATSDRHYATIMAGLAPPIVPRPRQPGEPGHCSRGHLVSGVNAYSSEPGTCVACARARADRAQARRRGETWTDEQVHETADWHYRRLADPAAAGPRPRFPAGTQHPLSAQRSPRQLVVRT